MSETEDFLAHYGVKGMRWGVRRDFTSSNKGSKSTKTRAQAAKDFIKTQSSAVRNLTPQQRKKIMIGAGISGTAAVATMLAGPLGGVSVSVVGRTLSNLTDETTIVKTETRFIDPSEL